MTLLANKLYSTVLIHKKPDKKYFIWNAIKHRAYFCKLTLLIVIIIGEKKVIDIEYSLSSAIN